MAVQRWVEVTPSQFPHERAGLDYLRERVPDIAPYRVWTNFEFRDSNGRWHEVDALLLGRGALHLIELKHYYGEISGNDRLWRRNGRTEESPLLLARRKAQYLASKLRDELLRWVRETGAGPVNPHSVIPWVQEAVFLHHPKTRVLLPEDSRTNLYGLDELAGSPEGLEGISSLIRQPPRRGEIGSNQEMILASLLARIGLVQRREREAGSWVIDDAGALDEGKGWQDWGAQHKETGDRARIRFFTSSDSDGLRTATRVARHEYSVMRRLSHDGLMRPVDMVSQDQLGPGIVLDWDEGLERLDLWLESHQDSLVLERRLEIVRRVGEALAYAHGNGIVHRGLSPLAVWIKEAAGPAGPAGHPGPAGAASPLTVKVSDWESLGRTEPDAGAAVGPGAGSATGVTSLGSSTFLAAQEAGLSGYEAPEGRWNSRNANRAAVDQFSLGALAAFVLSGQAPASSAADLRVRLREQNGIDISVEMPEAPSPLRDAILKATSPSPGSRFPSLGAFLDEMNASERLVEETALPMDPREAVKGDILGDGRFTVKRRLGTGSTALGLLVEDGRLTTKDKDRVLKVALNERAQERLVQEAEILHRVKGKRITALAEGPFDLGPTTALLLESAGETTLHDELRRSRLSLDDLERFGGDLLEALETLDRAGVDHRDIKPANLGVGRDSKKYRHLWLFDFSLSRAPGTDLTAGTPPYLDPFLGADFGRPVYDSAAERYAAAVVLYEMATGTRPYYGDPQADPSAVTDEVTLSRESFPSGIQDLLVDFFTQALARDASRRFDSVGAMRSAWRRIFGESTTTASQGSDDLADAVELDTPLAEAGLSSRALSGFTAMDKVTVHEAIGMDQFWLSNARGLSSATKQEMRSRIRQWRRKFPHADDGRALVSRGPLPGIEQTVQALLASVEADGGPVALQAVSLILGRGEHPVDAFSSQRALAASLPGGVSFSALSGALNKARAAWVADDSIQDLLLGFAAEVDRTLDESLGRVATPAEFVVALEDCFSVPTSRDDAQVRADRRALAGLLRLMVDERRLRILDGEQLDRIELRRRGRSGEVLLIGRDAAHMDAAERLGRAAHDAVEGLEGPLSLERSRSVVSAALERVESSVAADLRDGLRPLRLAVAVADDVALTAGGEFYPRAMAQHTALALALGASGSDEGMTDEQLRGRVAARFPDLEPLPSSRGDLEALVRDAGLDLRFEPGRNGSGRWVSPTLHAESASATTRRGTVVARNPSEVEDTGMMRTLVDSQRRRTYLVLGVGADRLDRLVAGLEQRFAPRVLSLSRALMDAMRQVLGSDPRFPSWEQLLQADGEEPGSRGRAAVARVAEMAMPRVRERLAEELAASDDGADDETAGGAAHGADGACRHGGGAGHHGGGADALGPAPLILTDVALLARYGQAAPLIELSDLTASRERAVWVVVPQFDVHTGPRSEGVPLTTSPSQFRTVDYEWADAVSQLGPEGPDGADENADADADAETNAGDHLTLAGRTH